MEIGAKEMFKKLVKGRLKWVAMERMGGWVVNGWHSRKMSREWRGEGENLDCNGTMGGLFEERLE